MTISKVFEKNDSKVFKRITKVIIFLCFIPLVLNFFGIEFHLYVLPESINAQYPNLENLFPRNILGSFTHLIFEWSSFCLSGGMLILAALYSYKRKEFIPVFVAVVFLGTAILETFGAIMGNLQALTVESSSNLVNYFWTTARLFNSIGLFVLIKLIRKNNVKLNQYKYFSSMLFISLASQFLAIIYMLGSQQLYDNYFIIAQFVKFVAFCAPLIGLYLLNNWNYRNQIHSYNKLKKNEAELILAKEKAYASLKEKSIFWASASHEIRTLLNAIVGIADVLTETKLTKDQSNYVNIFQRASNNLLALVNDILDFSKFEAGEMRSEKIGFNLEELVEDTLDFFFISASEKGLKLNANFSHDLPFKVTNDPTKLRQILVNLIGNAIKFTASGTINLNVTASKKIDDSHYFKFVVSDTGIGIPKDKQAKVFESYTQAELSTTREYGGTGLGLSICKDLVTILGGDIWIESDGESGSDFIFELPFTNVEYENNNHKKELINALNKKTIFLFSKDEFLIKEFSNYFAKLNVDLRSGDKKMISSANFKDLDFFIFDNDVCETESFVTYEKLIKEKSDQVSHLVISRDNFKDYEKIDVKTRDFLQVPFKRFALFEALQKTILLKDNSVANVYNLHERAENKSAIDYQGQYNILITDDSEDNIFLIDTFLKKTGYNYDFAENGQVALNKYKEKKYHLVLMDIQTPIMDGITATKKIREYEKSHGIKPAIILALTAHSSREDVKNSLEAGCNNHVVKPIKKKMLIESIEFYLKEYDEIKKTA